MLPLSLTSTFPSATCLFCSEIEKNHLKITKMADKVMNLGNKAVKAAMPHIKTFWYYAKVELAPPKVSEIPLAVKGFFELLGKAKSGAWKNVTVKEAFLNTIVATEVGCWFFVGECIGKRHIIGYKLN